MLRVIHGIRSSLLVRALNAFLSADQVWTFLSAGRLRYSFASSCLVRGLSLLGCDGERGELVGALARAIRGQHSDRPGREGHGVEVVQDGPRKSEIPFRSREVTVIVELDRALPPAGDRRSLPWRRFKGFRGTDADFQVLFAWLSLSLEFSKPRGT